MDLECLDMDAAGKMSVTRKAIKGVTRYLSQRSRRFNHNGSILHIDTAGRFHDGNSLP